MLCSARSVYQPSVLITAVYSLRCVLMDSPAMMYCGYFMFQQMLGCLARVTANNTPKFLELSGLLAAGNGGSDNELDNYDFSGGGTTDYYYGD